MFIVVIGIIAGVLELAFLVYCAVHENVKDIVIGIARRRGLQPRHVADSIRLDHPQTPFFIEVRESSSGIVVRLGCEDIKDYIREVVDMEDDPRGVIEELLDDMVSVAYEIAERLRRNGFKAILDTRSASMDVLSELEDALEE